MKKNVGTIDRIVRVIVAILVIVLYVTGAITGTLAIVLLVLSAIFILTSAISFCPLYFPLHISTAKKRK